MMDYQLVSIISLAGWLILAVGALASHRLSWRKGIRYALIWASAFLAVTFFVSLVQ